MRDEHRRDVVVAVVDDDDAVRNSLRFLLETAGYDVLTFGSAGEFLASPDRRRPTCMLVDQHMPQVTGLDLVARIREIGSDLPIALITGSPSPELTRRASQLGMTDVLEKPLQEQALMEFVEHAVG
jgi:two-component system response regulator FixJ